MNLEILLLLMVLPPLAGAALNGILGRRFSQATVSVIGCGGAGLSMVFALLSRMGILAYTRTARAFRPQLLHLDSSR